MQPRHLPSEHFPALELAVPLLRWPCWYSPWLVRARSCSPGGSRTAYPVHACVSGDLDPLCMAIPVRVCVLAPKPLLLHQPGRHLHQNIMSIFHFCQFPQNERVDGAQPQIPILTVALADLIIARSRCVYKHTCMYVPTYLCIYTHKCGIFLLYR